MTDPDLQKNDPVEPAQASEPVVSKPYIMPDDPETGSVESDSSGGVGADERFTTQCMGKRT